MKLLVTLIVLTILVLPIQSQTQEPLLPKEQWTQETKKWTAIALIAERDFPIPPASIKNKEHWKDTTLREYAAILYVLKNRWEQAYRKNPNYTFLHMVRGYCSGLKRPYTPRQRWLHGLNLNGTRPRRWPVKEVWESKQEAWVNTVLPFVDSWYMNEVEDPYHGKAWHWGAVSDPHYDSPLPRLGFKNIFYRR